MNLTEAIQFTTTVRNAWKPDAKGYKTAMINAQHCVDVLGDVDVSTIDAMSFISIQECLTAEGKSPATLNRITSALSTVLTVMLQFNYITHKPGFSNLKEPRGRTNFYSDEEIDNLITASGSLGNEIQDVILFASRTGARRGEIEQLKWSDVDFTKGEMTFLDTKNGDNRVLPLGGSLLELMKRLHKDRVNDDVFTLEGWQMLYQLRKAQKIAGVDQTKCFHTLRHSTASNLWKKGANLVQVMSVLGHRNAATSIRYSHADMDEKSKALALLCLTTGTWHLKEGAPLFYN